MLKMLLPLAALAVAACTDMMPDMSARSIYVMRHLNTPAGVNDPDLTAQGQANAERVATWFAGRKIDVLIVSNTKRAQQSAAPLAAAKGLTPILYDPRKSAVPLAQVRATAGELVVVGHSNTVPDIIEQLGGDRPADIPHEQFGDIWQIKGGKTVRHRIGE